MTDSDRGRLTTDTEGEPLGVRPVADADARLLWEWANDPEARASSLSTASIPWEEHLAWFEQKRADPRCLIYIVTEADGQPVGQVRFDVGSDGGAEVSLNIAPSARGRGYASPALRLACQAFVTAGGVGPIVAHIKPENKRSIRAFGAAGFAYEGTEAFKGHRLVRMVWGGMDRRR